MPQGNGKNNLKICCRGFTLRGRIFLSIPKAPGIPGFMEIPSTWNEEKIRKN